MSDVDLAQLKNEIDHLFAAGDFQQVRDRLTGLSIEFDDFDDEAWYCLRLGQASLELGFDEAAAKLLERAFRLNGFERFEGEDSKYIDSIERYVHYRVRLYNVFGYVGFALFVSVFIVAALLKSEVIAIPGAAPATLALTMFFSFALLAVGAYLSPYPHHMPIEKIPADENAIVAGEP